MSAATGSGSATPDPALSELVGELSIRCTGFRQRWAAHNVKRYSTGTQHFHHRTAGDLDLDYNAFDLGLTALERVAV